MVGRWKITNEFSKQTRRKKNDMLDIERDCQTLENIRSTLLAALEKNKTREEIGLSLMELLSDSSSTNPCIRLVISYVEQIQDTQDLHRLSKSTSSALEQLNREKEVALRLLDQVHKSASEKTTRVLNWNIWYAVHGSDEIIRLEGKILNHRVTLLTELSQRGYEILRIDIDDKRRTNYEEIESILQTLAL